MPRIPVTTSQSTVSALMADVRAAIAEGNSARVIPRSVFQETIAAVRAKLTPDEQHRLSPKDIETRAMAVIDARSKSAAHGLTTVRQRGTARVAALRDAIARAEKEAVRLKRPDVTVTKDELAEGMLSAPAIRELRLLRQDLQSDRIERRLASLNAAQKLAMLERAEQNGDLLTAAVIDELLPDELASLRPEPSDLEGPKRLRERLAQVEAARLTPAERETLAAWRGEADQLADQWRREAWQLEAMQSRGYVDVEATQPATV